MFSPYRIGEDLQTSSSIFGPPGPPEFTMGERPVGGLGMLGGQMQDWINSMTTRQMSMAEDEDQAQRLYEQRLMGTAQKRFNALLQALGGGY